MSEPKPWSADQSKQLAALFKSGEVDHTTKTTEYIRTVIANHFSDRTLKNFSQLYRRKCNEWALALTVAGKRRTDEEGKCTCLFTVFRHLLYMTI
jgi:hypothetical protein